ncbi:MAG TPA: hypothetical protein VEC60_14420, partial [Reyranella sp.]|nr:hypothetical protein [Reyranella sp.]
MRRALVLLAALLACADAAHAGEPSADERLVLLRSERALLQARADGAARLELLAPFRIEGLLTDALSARGASDSRRLTEIPAPRREAFAALAALNAALKQAVARPDEGAGTVAREA